MSAIKECIYVIIFLIIIYTLITLHRDEAKIEDKIFELVNQERVSVGVNSLVLDFDLRELAQSHSRKMEDKNSFKHSGDNVGENIIDSPIWYLTEGCGLTITNNQIAKCMVKGWEKSPGHYANIINKEYTETGVGIYCNIFQCLGTQNFRFEG